MDGNRTRQAEVLGLVGFEDRGAHQDADTSAAEPSRATARQRQSPASAVPAMKAPFEQPREDQRGG